MRRKRHVYPKYLVTYLKRDNETEEVQLLSESTSGKSIKVILSDGNIKHLRKDQIEYTNL